MPDLLWDDVGSLFTPDVMGTLPDVWGAGASVDDWQTVLDLVGTGDWRSEYSEGDVVMPLPRAEQAPSRAADAECPTLRVRPAPGVLAIFRFLAEETIDFDVDLRELQGQTSHRQATVRAVPLQATCRILGATAHPTGAWVTQIGRRGVRKTLRALENDIRDWTKTWNDNLRPFTWARTADEILERLAS